MSLHTLTQLLLWCSILNYVVLLIWFFLYTQPHQWMYRLLNRWFRLPAEDIDRINLMGISFYKIGIILFNLMPLIACYIVGR